MAYNFQPTQNFPIQNQQNYPPAPPPINQSNVQPLFPQPQGNVYNINSTLEVANVPVGAGMSDYNAGRNRYRDGGSESRMIDGIEMTMGAVVNFVENLIDYAETSQEKEIIRKYVNKLKNV